MHAKELFEIIKSANPHTEVIVQVGNKKYIVDKTDLIKGMQEIIVLSTKETNEILSKSN